MSIGGPHEVLPSHACSQRLSLMDQPAAPPVSSLVLSVPHKLIVLAAVGRQNLIRAVRC